MVHGVSKFLTDNDVDIILTFDNGGVSGHPNHVDTYNLLKSLPKSEDFQRRIANRMLENERLKDKGKGPIQKIVEGRKKTREFPSQKLVSVGYLETVPLVRKYCGVLDLFWTAY